MHYYTLGHNAPLKGNVSITKTEDEYKFPTSTWIVDKVTAYLILQFY